jgi:hypothetical protein
VNGYHIFLADALERLLERRNTLSGSHSVCLHRTLASAIEAVSWEEIAEAFLDETATRRQVLEPEESATFRPAQMCGAL